jgi:hypothetical protein
MTALLLAVAASAAAPVPKPAPDPQEQLDGTEAIAPAAVPSDQGSERQLLFGAHLGVTGSLGALGVTPWPRIELVYQPAQGRLRGLGEIGFTSARAHDDGSEPQKYSYTATVSDLRFGAGGLVRLAPRDEAIVPELGLTAQLHVLWVGIATEVAGIDGGQVGQTLARPGGTARAGIAARAGSGEIPVDLVLDEVPIGGDLAGPSVDTELGISIGWRVPVPKKTREER